MGISLDIFIFGLNILVQNWIMKKYNYNPAVELVINFQTGNFKQATINFIELIIMCLLVFIGIKYTLLVLLKVLQLILTYFA